MTLAKWQLTNNTYHLTHSYYEQNRNGSIIPQEQLSARGMELRALIWDAFNALQNLSYKHGGIIFNASNQLLFVIHF